MEHARTESGLLQTPDRKRRVRTRGHAGALGITTRNSAPRPPGPSPTSIEPPAVVTRCLQTARPRPVPAPAALVVKNGSNTRARSGGGTPGPSSVTVIGGATPPGAGRAVIAS